MPFNATTSYAGDWQYQDDIEDGLLAVRDEYNQDSGTTSIVKCKRKNITETDLAAALSEADVVASDTVIAVWKVDPADPTPQRGDKITIDNLDNLSWHVLQVVERRRGPHWDCICRQELPSS